MLKAHKHWYLPKISVIEIHRLMKELNLPYIVAATLLSRGISDTKEITAFLNTSFDNLLSPKSFLGIREAGRRILQAITEKQRIYIHMDYDADGLTSGALLYWFLKRLNADVIWGTSSRFAQGYGFYRDHVDIAASQEAELIITVDCGTTDTEAVHYARQFHGIDVIVLDHHAPQKPLAPATAIVNPYQPGCPYPFKNLAAVGVVFKVIQWMATQRNISSSVLTNLLDFVAVGTIGDVVPLQEENRILVKLGLNALRQVNRPCWIALGETIGIHPQDWTEDDIAFTVVPMLNASGRLSDPNAAVKLLLTDDINEARRIAPQLKNLNEERKALGSLISAQAIEQVTSRPNWQNERVIVTSHPGWHKGLLGIVCSTLKETFGRPAIALTHDGNLLHGSGRSVPGFNLVEALHINAHLLEQYGGHKMAVGLTLKVDNLEALRSGLCGVANQHPAHVFIPNLTIDGTLTLEALSEEKTKALELLSPFGADNPKPLFLVSNLKIVSWQSFGAKNNHHRLTVTDGTHQLEAVVFKRPEADASLLAKNPIIDLVVTPETNIFKGKHYYRLKIHDWNQVA